MKYFYLVAPLVKLPLKKSQLFTYHAGQLAPVGSLVLINFGFKQTEGIVIAKTKRPSYPTKKLTLKEKEALTRDQIDLAQSLAQYYYAPLGTTLKLFTLKKTKTAKVPQNEVLTKKNPKVIPTAKQRKAISQIQKSSHSHFLLFGPASSGKTEVLMQLAKKILAKKQQVLILVPEIFLGYHEISRYYQRFCQTKNKTALKPSELTFFHSDLKNSEATFVHEKVKTGKIKLIVATRRGVFLPFKNLGLIAIDEEQSTSYKEWDSAPFYHAGKAAELLAEQFSAKLIFSSATPSLETFHRAQEKEIDLIKLPVLKTQKIKVKKPIVQIIPSFLKFRENFHFSLDRELKQRLAITFKNQELAEFLVSQRGESRRVICQDCKTTLLCPTCQTPLVHTRETFKCLHCTYKISSLSGKCHQCGSFRLIDFGFGTKSIAGEIKDNFPGAKIGIADIENFSRKKNRQSIIRKIEQGKLDVLVGTYAIAKGFDFQRLSLVVIPDAKSFYGKSNYLFDEQHLANLFQLAGRVNRPGSRQNGVCLVYTRNINNLLLKFLAKWNWEEFLIQEKANRKALSLPPFGKLIKLTCKMPRKVDLAKETKMVYSEMNLIKRGLITITLEKEIKRRANFQQSLVIKLRNKQVSPQIRKILLQLNQKWHIDVDPINV